MDFWEDKFLIASQTLIMKPCLYHLKNLMSIFNELDCRGILQCCLIFSGPINNFVGTASSLQVRGEVLPANFNELKAVSPYLDEMKKVLRDNGILHRL